MRDNGSFALSGMQANTYSIFKTINVFEYTEEEATQNWAVVFKEIETEVHNFLSENPTPDSSHPTQKVEPVYALMLDIHAGKVQQVLERISYFRAQNIGSGFSGPKGDAYDYIEQWGRK